MRLERRRFPQPWDIEERNASCIIVMDANRFPVCYVYFGARSAHSGGPDDSRRGASDRGEYRQAAAAGEEAAVTRALLSVHSSNRLSNLAKLEQCLFGLGKVGPKFVCGVS